jgi:restriction system protein
VFGADGEENSSNFICAAINVNASVRGSVVTIAIVIVLVIASLVAFHWYQIGQQERAQLDHAQQIVVSHAEELTVKRKQLTVKSSYGLVDTSKWADEMAFFVSRVVGPEVGAFRGENLRRVFEAIESATSHFDSLTPQLSPAMDGVEYERFVADLLSIRGWDTRLTKGSGDQGVDVVAQKQGIKAVIQCKLYSYPVGNDAVQQVIAGRTFYNGDVAAVVTNATFTGSARQLASAAHVLLLHHDQVGQLDREAGTTPVPGANERASEVQESGAIPHAGSVTTGEVRSSQQTGYEGDRLWRHGAPCRLNRSVRGVEALRRWSGSLRNRRSHGDPDGERCRRRARRKAYTRQARAARRASKGRAGSNRRLSLTVIG